MAQKKKIGSADLRDPRWGDQVPWFLRHANFTLAGSFETFFARLQQRLARIFSYNEFKIANRDHFGARLETESCQRFKSFPSEELLQASIDRYFNPKQMFQEALDRAENDTEEDDLTRASATRKARSSGHLRMIKLERIATLEALLQILPKEEKEAFRLLLRDLHRAMAESGINLKIDEQELVVLPLEEPLLQQEVVDNLLPRLAERFPDRAMELVKAYHDLVQGVDGNTVFGNAFKTLEAIAQGVKSDKNVALYERSSLEKNFPNLHPTIRETILKLASHRGDEAGHARKGPDPHEMRYLLFAICNIALL